VSMSSVQPAPARKQSSICRKGSTSSSLGNSLEPALRLRNLSTRPALRAFIEAKEGHIRRQGGQVFGRDSKEHWREFTNMLTKCAFRHNSGMDPECATYPVGVRSSLGK
jgi:hypothetical protein